MLLVKEPYGVIVRSRGDIARGADQYALFRKIDEKVYGIPQSHPCYNEMLIAASMKDWHQCETIFLKYEKHVLGIHGPAIPKKEPTGLEGWSAI